MLTQWRPSIAPVWAAFWTELRDLLPPEPGEAPADWANALRDRLGLAHYRLRRHRPFHVIVFRYRVERVLPLVGATSIRPIATPNVLDGPVAGSLYPAPDGAQAGHVVDLAGAVRNTVHEVVHPPSPSRADDAFRLGVITTDPPDDLEPARRAHLRIIRADKRWASSSATTDSDLVP